MKTRSLPGRMAMVLATLAAGVMFAPLGRAPEAGTPAYARPGRGYAVNPFPRNRQHLPARRLDDPPPDVAARRARRHLAALRNRAAHLASSGASARAARNLAPWT